VLDRLKAKGLVVPLTPEGRGHVVTHALYEPHELEALKAQFGTGTRPATQATAAAAPQPFASGDVAAPNAAAGVTQAGGYRPPEAELIPRIRQEIEQLRSQLKQLQSDVEQLAERQQEMENEVQRFRDALGG